MTLQSHAIGYAVDGFRVLPLHPRGKRPRWDDWTHEATSDCDKIAAHWQANPDDNIGLLTGNGFVVLDLDTGGVESLQELQRFHGELPRTRTVRTGSGGWHLYYRAPCRVPNSSRLLGPGIDVRGDGGQVVAPPSVHPSGALYELKRLGDLAELPASWCQLLQERAVRGPVQLAEDTVFADGSRNQELARVAGAWRRTGLDIVAITAALLEVNALHCRPPLPEAEVRQIALSIGSRPAPGKLITATEKPKLQFVRAADVELERVEWIWHGYLPAGALVLQDGDPSLGKSTIWIDLAARISQGQEMPLGAPNGLGAAAAVTLMMNEDGMGNTVRPRLEAAGADLARVHILDGSFTVPDDVEALERHIVDSGTRLVVLDPLSAHLGGASVDLSRDKHVRQALGPLIQVAQRHGVVIGANRHLVKSKDGSAAMQRGLGGIGIIAVSRVAWAVAPDKDDATGRRRIVAPIKHNLTKQPASLSYHIEECLVGDGIEASRIVWDGVSSKTADDLIAGDGMAGASEDDRCRAWMAEQLALDSDCDILAAAIEAGFTAPAIKRAAFDLDVTTL